MDPLSLLGALRDRYFVSPKTAGVFYARLAEFSLAGYTIGLPCELEAIVRSQIVRTNLPGMGDDVKEVTGFGSWDLTLSGIAGDFRVKVVPPLPEIPMVSGVAAGGMDTIGTLLGTDAYIDKVEMLAELAGILRKTAAGAGAVAIADADGVLAHLGVTKVVPGAFSLKRAVDGNLWTWSYPMISDDGRDPLERLFPSEEAGG